MNVPISLPVLNDAEPPVRNTSAKPIHILPHDLYIEPTSVCNLHCRMCYTNVINGAGKRVLDSARVLDFVRRFREAAAVPILVYWCGTGEVFLHRYFPQMVNELLDHGTGIEQVIQTNGTVRRLKEFTSLNRLDFSVSIDGYRQFHEWHRGPKTYDRTLAFCREAVDLGCRSMKVRCLLTRDNIRYLDEFHQDLLDRIGHGNFELELNAAYRNDVLREVRDMADAVNPQDIEDDQAITFTEARRIIAENYAGRYEIDEADTVDNYLSLNTYGVYTCCHGVLKIGEMEDDLSTLAQRMTASEDQCRSCGMFPCQ